MLLDVPALARPIRLRAAEGRDVFEVLMLGGLPFEELPIVKLGRIARAVDQPDFSAPAKRWPTIRKEMLNEAAHRSYAGAGSDKDGVGQRLAQRKQTMRAMEADRLSRLH